MEDTEDVRMDMIQRLQSSFGTSPSTLQKDLFPSMNQLDKPLFNTSQICAPVRQFSSNFNYESRKRVGMPPSHPQIPPISPCSQIPMEKSFADEIYGESLKHSAADVNPSSSALHGHDSTHEDDSSWFHSSDELEETSDLDREWKHRHNKFHKIGYRDGLIAGKETSAQEGFNIGFKESVLVGYDWGLVRGFSSALSSLPESLREKLVKEEENRENFQSLEKSVHSISTTDALKLFNDEIVENGLSQEESQSGLKNDCHPGSDNTLKDYYVKLTTLLNSSNLPYTEDVR